MEDTTTPKRHIETALAQLQVRERIWDDFVQCALMHYGRHASLFLDWDRPVCHNGQVIFPHIPESCTDWSYQFMQQLMRSWRLSACVSVTMSNAGLCLLQLLGFRGK